MPYVATFCQQHEYKCVWGPFKTPTQLSPPASRHQKGHINNGIYAVVHWFLNCLFRLSYLILAINPDSLKILRQMLVCMNKLSWDLWVKKIIKQSASLFLLLKLLLLIETDAFMCQYHAQGHWGQKQKQICSLKKSVLKKWSVLCINHIMTLIPHCTPPARCFSSCWDHHTAALFLYTFKHVEFTKKNSQNEAETSFGVDCRKQRDKKNI